MTTTKLSFTISFACLILFIAISCNQVDHINTVVQEEIPHEHHEHHDHQHTSNSIYYDFRGLEDTQVDKILSNATEEELAVRAESYRLTEFLNANKLERVLTQLKPTELLNQKNLAMFLTPVQLEASKLFVPVNEKINDREPCRYYKSYYSCTKSSSGSGGTMTTLPNQGDGVQKKKCYYRNSNGRVHYHHTHTLGSC